MDHEISHYLLYLVVAKDSPIIPIGIVFNCSFEANTETSLNDCLQTDPNLMSDLKEVLVKFRTNEFACVADISRAFPRLSLSKDDRNFTSFYGLKISIRRATHL